ncbi:hypothetical protein EFA46_003730 [Halarchaeum sp. CBA1220]|uniref:hypothetical protein n=1 Tax=Halarchaeum sp. CBA1220 TaxID=1853682 RepID=UPI000F3AA5E8|nr:hypothetical protein [Halarchaeum sp. CBA1220]QLC33351.1 hypothetical protein EFA46_003730 [Halarchaeum sp. CBA1220]
MDRRRLLAGVAFGALVMVASFALAFGPLNPCTNAETFEVPRMDASVAHDGGAAVVTYEGAATLTETSTVSLAVAVGATGSGGERTVLWAAANGSGRAALPLRMGAETRVDGVAAGETVAVVWTGYESAPAYCPPERGDGPLTRVVAEHTVGG